MRRKKPGDAPTHLAALVALRDERADLDAREDREVGRALAAGVSFAALGRIFDFSRQTAAERWGALPEATAARGARRPEPEDLDRYLDPVRAVCSDRAELDRRERETVHRAIEAGLSYEDVGKVYGITKQTAWEMWRPSKPAAKARRLRRVASIGGASDGPFPTRVASSRTSRS